jgi:hypothetical protein
MPKQQSIMLKDFDTQRIIKSNIKNNLSRFLDRNVKFEIFVEDTVAVEYLKECGGTPTRMYSVFDSFDLKFINSGQVNDEVKDFTNPYDVDVLYVGDRTKFKPPTIDILAENVDKYNKMCVDFIKNKRRDVFSLMIGKARAVLMFTDTDLNNRGVKATDTAMPGDGRLCMCCDIYSGNITVYYGGFYVDRSFLPVIVQNMEEY